MSMRPGVAAQSLSRSMSYISWGTIPSDASCPPLSRSRASLKAFGWATVQASSDASCRPFSPPLALCSFPPLLLPRESADCKSTAAGHFVPLHVHCSCLPTPLQTLHLDLAFFPKASSIGYSHVSSRYVLAGCANTMEFICMVE